MLSSAISVAAAVQHPDMTLAVDVGRRNLAPFPSVRQQEMVVHLAIWIGKVIVRRSRLGKTQARGCEGQRAYGRQAASVRVFTRTSLRIGIHFFTLSIKSSAAGNALSSTSP